MLVIVVAVGVQQANISRSNYSLLEPAEHMPKHEIITILKALTCEHISES